MNIKNKKVATIMITVFMLFGAMFTSIQPVVQEAHARDLVKGWMCKHDLTREIYQATEGDYFHYLLRSKSAMATTDSVNKGVLNRILGVAGFNFQEANESILGRELDPVDLSEDSSASANESAPRVSAFDRFGMAGLKWSSYAGEWKYNHVDPCREGQEISPVNYGDFYEGRLEPQSTYGQVATSKDVRSLQFSKGFGSTWMSTFSNNVANAFFSLAKFSVTMAISMIGFAFTDVTSLMGMTTSGTGVDSVAGIFTSLFNTVFTGFVLISVLFTALYIFYQGALKRQFRMAMNSLLKVILIFIIAIVMSTNPSYWVAVPNKVATYGQALVLNATSGLYGKETNYVSLCDTNVADLGKIDLDDKNAELFSEFEKVSENMKSMIGCHMWEQFLFKPWVRGQFGAEYEDLSSDKLGNINSSWVGKGSVPVGGGKTIDNWALFHLSTQTNAHAQVGNDNMPIYINGVDADWWRVVDALSNYDEEPVTNSISGSGDNGDFSVEVETYQPSQASPTAFWENWIGNNSAERSMTAIIAAVYGVVGSLAPFMFALNSTILGIGITLMMMTSPIFLLFGIWAGRGDGIFMGWLSALANMVLKKIMYGFLLILSVSITVSVMELAYTIGIATSFILLIITTVILIKNQEAILQTVAQIDFGGSFDPRRVVNEHTQRAKNVAQQAREVGTAAIVGGVVGRSTGQGFIRGARMASSSQLRNTLYRSQFGIQVAMELESRSPDGPEEYRCSFCFAQLGMRHKVAYRDEDGNYFCTMCADEIGTEDLYEVNLDLSGFGTKGQEVRSRIATENRSYISHSTTRDMMESKVIDGKYYWNNEKVQDTIKDNIRRLREDAVVFSNVKIDLGAVAKPPSIPEPIASYIDLALINEAWTRGDLELVENTYKVAWSMWYEENAENVEGLTEEEIEQFKKEIMELSPEIDARESNKLTERFIDNSHLHGFERYSNNKDKRTYVYQDGKLKFEAQDNRDQQDIGKIDKE